MEDITTGGGSGGREIITNDKFKPLTVHKVPPEILEDRRRHRLYSRHRGARAASSIQANHLVLRSAEKALELRRPISPLHCHAPKR